MTEEMVELGRRLQGSGLRLTPQRLLILDVLRSSEGHVSAEEICERVRQTYPFVNISTVYRTLDVLRGLDLALSADFGDGSLRYHWAEKGRHHHMRCQRCGMVFDLDEDVTQDLAQAIDRRYAFRANLTHLTIFGTCRDCLD